MNNGAGTVVGPAGRYGLTDARRFRRRGVHPHLTRYSLPCVRTTTGRFEKPRADPPAPRPKSSPGPPTPWPAGYRRFPVPADRVRM